MLVSGFKSEWHENLKKPKKKRKAKITEFGDQQASKIHVRTKLPHYSGDQRERPGHPSWNSWEPEGLPEIFIRATNSEVWAP